MPLYTRRGVEDSTIADPEEARPDTHWLYPIASVFGVRIIFTLTESGPPFGAGGLKLRREVKVLFTVLVAFAMVSTIATGALAKKHMESKDSKMSALGYSNEWRKLWEDHITWTRLVIVAVLDDLSSNATQNYTARLLQNPGDMGKALAPFYGKEQANLFADLVTQHLVQAAGILVDIKTGVDPTAALAAWYQNAHNISVLMNKLNPNNWGLGPADRMWKQHLDATVNETLANFGKNWNAEVEAYNLIVNLALMMADFTSNGIIKQFPMMFTGVSIAHT